VSKKLTVLVATSRTDFGELRLGELRRTPLRRRSTAKGIASVRSTGHLRTVAPIYLVKLGIGGLPEASQPPIPPFICANLISGASVLPR
jgi:hypothetical protein